ncbi:MAG TPA: outer membrane protein assembly factor BamE [Alphaproteobacteria bacterium]|nr:outer membrane protein assembly factor BamE [Alphaproteobacteria bacterium]
MVTAVRPGRCGLRRTAALALLAALSACTPRIDTHGHYPDPEALSSIEPGVQSKEEVLALLGSPTTVATLDPNRWYYVTRVTENVSFYDPSLIEETVVAIVFDEEGRVASIENVALNETPEVEVVERETATQGKDVSIFEQLLGNLGRFPRVNDQGR